MRDERNKMNIIGMKICGFRLENKNHSRKCRNIQCEVNIQRHSQCCTGISLCLWFVFEVASDVPIIDRVKRKRSTTQIWTVAYAVLITNVQVCESIYRRKKMHLQLEILPKIICDNKYNINKSTGRERAREGEFNELLKSTKKRKRPWASYARLMRYCMCVRARVSISLYSLTTQLYTLVYSIHAAESCREVKQKIPID